jgi:hypothetical protein
MTTTDCVAIIGLCVAGYGAILSTVNSVIQVMAHRRDRADVVLKVRRNMTHTDPRYKGMKLTVVTAANRGKRPVNIHGFAVLLLDSWDVFWLRDINPPLPYEITEGNWVSAHIDEGTEDRKIVEAYYVWDSIGREFKINVAPWYRILISRLRRKFAPVKRIEKKR